MANSNKSNHEAKIRLAKMEANQAALQATLQRRKRDNVIAFIAMGVALAIAVALALTVFSPKSDADAAASGDSTATSTSTAAAAEATADATATAVQTNSPTVPDASTAKGKTFTGTLTLNGKAIGVSLDGTKAPQAAAVFKSLADSGFMTGKSCHRLADSTDFGVLQCGSLNGDGQGDPDYQWGPVENTPADGSYPAGTIAVARSSSTYSNGTQFFITFKDTILPQTDGGYTIVGKVTSGLDVVTDIAAAGIVDDATDGAPKTPVTIDSFKLS